MLEVTEGGLQPLSLSSGKVAASPNCKHVQVDASNFSMLSGIDLMTVAMREKVRE